MARLEPRRPAIVPLQRVARSLRDAALTRVGSVQDIKRRGTKFDAIFVSHMRRARQTCQLVMEECDPDCTLPHQIDHRLAEKSFGIFAGRNINVLRMVRCAARAGRAPQPPLERACSHGRLAQVYGFKTFERLTASGHEEPPAAEPLSEVFRRVSDFYDSVVKPLTDQGKNVLVVSHQYALEPLALYLGGKVRRARGLPQGRQY